MRSCFFVIDVNFFMIALDETKYLHSPESYLSYKRELNPQDQLIYMKHSKFKFLIEFHCDILRDSEIQFHTVSVQSWRTHSSHRDLEGAFSDLLITEVASSDIQSGANEGKSCNMHYLRQLLGYIDGRTSLYPPETERYFRPREIIDLLIECFTNFPVPRA